LLQGVQDTNEGILFVVFDKQQGLEHLNFLVLPIVAAAAACWRLS